MATTSLISPAQGADATPRRRVFDLALPAVGEQLLNTMVGLAATYLVGNMSPSVAAQLGYSSTVALNAAGLGGQFFWIVTVLFMAVGVGSTALVSRAVGANDTDSLAGIVRQSLLLAVAVGVITTAGGLLLAEPFLRLVGASAEVVPPGTMFIQISALAFLPTAVLFAGTACLRGAGDTRTPLLVMLGVNVASVLLAWLLIDGNFGMPALGVQGAAIGTAVGRGGGGLVVLLLLLIGRSGLRFQPGGRRVAADLGGLGDLPGQPAARPPSADRTTLRRLINVGLPSAGEQLIFQAALLIFATFVTGLGEAAYAAHNLAITIESLSFLPGLGYAAAVSALVGQALGARDPRLAERYAYESLLQGGLMMALLGSLMVFFPHQLVSIFTNDPAVVAAAEGPLRAAGLIQPALAVSFITLGALRGAGDTRWPMFSRLITTWVVRLPVTLLLVGWLDAGMAGVWMAMCCDFTLQAIMALRRLDAGRWKDMQV